MANAKLPKLTPDAFELLALVSDINSIVDLDYLLEKLDDAAKELLGCQASSIMLLDDARQSLYFKVATGEKGGALKKMTLPLGSGVAGWVAREIAPLIVNDAANDSRFAVQFDKTSGFTTRQILAVPMMAKGELVGVAEVVNREDGAPFTQADVEILKSLAGVASVAISNAKLISDQKNFFSHILELLASAIETSKPGMESHPNHCAYLACAIGKRMGVPDAEYRHLYYAGLLHDIGYLGLKNRRLSREFGLTLASAEDQHVLMSVKMLEGINIFQGAVPVIRHHHENYDGSGFPDKLSGEAIPSGARILRLIEAMEELRMAGGFSGPELKERALREAKSGSGSRFDPAAVAAFVQLLDEEERIWEI